MQFYNKHKQPRRISLASAAMSAAISALAGLAIIAPLSAAPLSTGQGDNGKGFEISARSDRSDTGFGDSTAKLTMVLHNAAGERTERNLSLRTLEKESEEVGDKSLIVFDSPADINGTALLSHAKILDADNQWLFLPALKRIKRISSVNKSGPFVGSEFAFEDFTSQELNKFNYKYLRSEACSELMCDVVERTPRYEHSGYTRQVTWVDQKLYQVRRVEFYDRRGAQLKILTMDDYRQYKGKYWRAHKMHMKNLRTNKRTELVYSDYQFANGFKKRDFHKTTLNRIR